MYRDYLDSGTAPTEAFTPHPEAGEGASPFRPEYEAYIRRYPGRGTLKVQISVARGAYPLKNVLVDVSQDLEGVRYNLYRDVTDLSGIVDNMVLPARALEGTLNYDEGQIPEAEYMVTITHPDFQPISDCRVVVHDRIETILPISLVPIPGEDG